MKSEIYLFTTSTCPNCKDAEKWGKKVFKRRFKKIVVDKDKEGYKLAEKYEIRHVPAFVEVKESGIYTVYTLDDYNGK